MSAPFRLSLRSSLAGCLALVLTLALPACGRRGALEAPPDGSAPAAPATTRSGRAVPADARLRAAPTRSQPQSPASAATRSPGLVQDTAEDLDTDEDEPEQGSLLVNPQPTPSKRRGRAYTVPTEPFILDPLL